MKSVCTFTVQSDMLSLGDTDMSQAAKTKDNRIDLRVDETAKKLIERAASIAGMSISSFTLSTTLRAAREEIAAYEQLALSNRDRDLFVATIENPPRANEALRSAMKQFKEKYK